MLELMLAVAVLAQPVNSLAELRAAAMGAGPGDRIVLESGVYEGSVWLEGLRGEPGRPITIAGEDPEDPPIIRGGTECVHLVAPAWVTVEDLVLEGASGNGINIDDGGGARPAEGIVLRRLVVRDIGPRGNRDGIKLSGLARFVVEGCTVERWGDGGSGIDMVGCREGEIRDCTLRHGDTAGSNGVQMKGGTREVAVRGCRFEHAGRRAVNIGGSTGPEFFRPPLGGEGSGAWGGDARYEAAGITVEDCTFVGSEAAVAFVGVDGAVVRFNTIYRPTKWVLRILQETRLPGFVPSRGGRFEDNIVVFDLESARSPNIGDATEPGSFAFARNLWFFVPDPSRSEPRLPTKEEDGVYGADPGLRDPEGGDFAPAADGPGAGKGRRG